MAALGDHNEFWWFAQDGNISGVLSIQKFESASSSFVFHLQVIILLIKLIIGIKRDIHSFFRLLLSYLFLKDGMWFAWDKNHRTNIDRRYYVFVHNGTLGSTVLFDRHARQKRWNMAVYIWPWTWIISTVPMMISLMKNHVISTVMFDTI